MNIFEDEREIVGIVCGPEEIFVGVDGVTSIDPYFEDGQMARIIWFRVRQNAEVIARVNSAYVSKVLYNKESIGG